MKKSIKKIVLLMLTLSLVVGGCFALVACDKNKAEKIKMNEIELSSEEYAFIVKKGDSALKNQVATFMEDKSVEIAAIMSKFLNATPEELDTFGFEVQTETVDSTKELKVATNLDFAPFEYAVGNKIGGIDMEIAKLLATYLGKTLVVVHMEFDSVILELGKTETDFNIGMAGLTIDAKRAETVDFTVPYFNTTQVLLTKVSDTTFDGITTKDAMLAKLATLTGKAAKCGGQSGTTSQFFVNGNEGLEFEGFANLTFGGYTSAGLAVKDMQNGNIAFVIVDKVVAQALVKAINA